MSTIKVDTIQDAAGVFEHARLVQVVNVIDSASATGTTTVSADDSIMQNTEGDEYMSLAVTPTNASNKLLIHVQFMFGHSVSSHTPVFGIFQDSTAGALSNAMVDGGWQANTVQQNLNMYHYMTAGTTSATTFKFRAGGQSGTLNFNGFGGARKMGGLAPSSITIWEFRA